MSIMIMMIIQAKVPNTLFTKFYAVGLVHFVSFTIHNNTLDHYISTPSVQMRKGRFSDIKLFHGLPWGLISKEPTCHAGDESSILGSGRSPGGGHGNPLQHHCLRTPWTERPDTAAATDHARIFLGLVCR